MVLDVGVLVLVAAAGEDTELRRRHAHRAGALEHVFQTDAGLAPQGAGHGVEGLGALDLVHRAYLQMVLQVLTDPRQFVDDVDAVLLEQLTRPDTGKLQDLG